MLRSRLLLLAALALPACTVSSSGLPDETSQNPDPTNPGATTEPGTTKEPDAPKPATKAVYEYASMPLPAADLEITEIAGSASNDVWVLGTPKGATQNDRWAAYHYDGNTWTKRELPVQKGRSSFGMTTMGSRVFIGFNYPADVIELSGTSLASRLSDSGVSTGDALVTVGSKVFVGTQINYNAGPLYEIAASGSKQIPGVSRNSGSVLALWGASEDDVWIGRPKSLARLKDGTYSDEGGMAFGLSGTASDDVWAVRGMAGVSHFDGTDWSPVPVPDAILSDAPDKVYALSKDEVIVTTKAVASLWRYDGKAFVEEDRPSAPSYGRVMAVIGDEAWFVEKTSITRLAPKK